MTNSPNSISTQQADTLATGQRIRYAAHDWTVSETLPCAGTDNYAVIAREWVTRERKVLIFTHPAAAVQVVEWTGRA